MSYSPPLSSPLVIINVKLKKRVLAPTGRQGLGGARRNSVIISEGFKIFCSRKIKGRGILFFDYMLSNSLGRFALLWALRSSLIQRFLLASAALITTATEFVFLRFYLTRIIMSW